VINKPHNFPTVKMVSQTSDSSDPQTICRSCFSDDSPHSSINLANVPEEFLPRWNRQSTRAHRHIAEPLQLINCYSNQQHGSIHNRVQNVIIPKSNGEVEQFSPFREEFMEMAANNQEGLLFAEALLQGRQNV
jgi:hypothetical protein